MPNLNQKRKLLKLLWKLSPDGVDPSILESAFTEVEKVKSLIPQPTTPQDLSPLYKEIQDILTKLNSQEKLSKEEKKTLEESIKELQKKIDDSTTEKINLLRTEINQRLAQHGGGSPSRQIKINGTDYLTRYTDMNFIGSITAVNNDTKKNVDVTFAGGVSSIIAGTNVTISPVGGTGNVTINATAQDLSAYLKLDQTTPQTTIGTFTFPQIIDSGLTASYAVVTNASKQLSSLLYTNVNTGNSLVSRDSAGNSAFNNVISTVIQTNATGQTIAMTYGSGGGQEVYGTGNITFNLPDATYLYQGEAYYFNNNSTGMITIYKHDGTTMVGTVTSGGYAKVDCDNNSTVNGEWDIHYYIASGGTSSQFVKGDGSLDSSTYLTDAPSDGSTYGRKNGAWAVAGGSQTPWTSDINGGGYNLTNVGGLTETFAGATQILSFTSPNEYSTSGITVKDNTSTGKAGVQAFWDTNLDPTTETQQDVSTGTVRMSLIPDDGDSTPHFKIEMMAAGGSWGSHITPLDINLNGVFLSGNVGIGVSPSYLLDVNGDVNIASGKYYRYNGAIFSFADTTLHNYFSGGAGNLTATGTNNAGFGPVDYNAYWTTGSLGSLTTGQQNTAIGVVAGAGITTGSYNMVFGYAAMGSANASEDCAIGRLSLNSDTGGYNTGVGNTSLYANTSGYQNVGIGKDAGRGNTTGHDLTFIGFQSGYTDGSVTTPNNLVNSSAFGSNAQVTASNCLVLGGTGTYAVNVGIGKTAPTARLHLPAGTATAGTAPQKFTAGTLLTTPELGALEFVDDGTNGHLYITRNIAGVLTRTLIV